MLAKIKKLFFGKKVLLVGLGLQGGGAGTARFLCKAGAKLTITDQKSAKELTDSIKKLPRSGIKFVLGRHQKKDFVEADIIIKNPAVPRESPYISYARKLGKPTLSEAQIFFKLVPREKIIGITGTKGKSTTAMLLAHFLKPRFNIRLVGNMPGRSALETLIGLKIMPDFFVYELSSFNLEGLKTSPRYAVITNIFPDHLNRYKNFSEYKKAKANIFKYQKKGDFLWRGDKMNASRKKHNFDLKTCLISPTSFQAAYSVARYLGIKEQDIKRRLKTFKPAEGRLEYLGKIKGAHVINDTASTNPDSAIFSIQQVKKCLHLLFSKIILIAGGENKKLSYKDFSRKIKKLKKVILIPGSASLQIKGKNILRVNSLDAAVAYAFKSAKTGDCVLFSPAAASFNLFQDEFARGQAFKKSVQKIEKSL